MEEKNKILLAATAKQLRDLVLFVNQEGIKREDIVQIFQESNQYIMLYFK